MANKKEVNSRNVGFLEYAIKINTERKEAHDIFWKVVVDYLVKKLTKINLVWFETITMIDKYWNVLLHAMSTYERSDIVTPFRQRYKGIEYVFDFNNAFEWLGKGRARARMMEEVANAYARLHCDQQPAGDRKLVKWCPYFQRITFVCKLKIVLD